MSEFSDVTEVVPVLEPEGQSSLVKPGGQTFLANLERAAAIGPRMQKAIMLLCVSHTFSEDWEVFGKGDKARACLGSAGAERLIRSMDVEFFDWKDPEKQEWEDEHGKAYRYIYRCSARMWGKVIMSQGTFSSRDKLLGWVGDTPRPLHEINEGHIMTAAYHICRGEAIKALLGLRSVPERFLDEMLTALGKDTTKKGKVTHQEGTKGGTPDADREKGVEDDKKHRTELGELLMDMCYGDEAEGQKLLIEMSSWVNDEGEKIPGKAKRAWLSGIPLVITLKKARAAHEEWKKNEQGEPGSEG